MNYYAGIDLGGTNIKCGIVDEEGRIIIQESVPTHSEKGFFYVTETMTDLVIKLARETKIDVKAVGVGSPGMIDGERGVVVYSNNLAWQKISLAAELKNRLRIPIRITNDANAAAYGEYACGEGKQYDSIVLLTLGTGVGSGIVLNGKLFEGSEGAGSELGHAVIRACGEKCACGRRGCLEQYVSATALIRQTRRAMEKDKTSALWQLCGGNSANINGKTAFDGKRAGDKTALKVVGNYIRYLAEGIANIANVIRPQAVLLGGGISAEGAYLTEPLQKRVNKLMLGHGRYAPVKILAATLGNDAGLVGAAMLAKEKV